MKYIDLHCDTLTELKEGETLVRNHKNVDLKSLKKGGCVIQCASIFIPTGTYTGVDRKEAIQTEYDRVVSVYKRELNANPKELYRVLTRRDIPDIRQNDKMQDLGTGILLTIEDGGVMGGEMQKLYRAYEDGVRLVTLTWNHENEIGYPNSTDRDIMQKGLKPFGFEVLEEMNRLGMVIDVSHLSDGGFLNVAEFAKKTGMPFVASTGQSNNTIAQICHLPLAFVHGFYFNQFCQSRMMPVLLHHKTRNHTCHLTTIFQYSICHRTHQANTSGSIYQTNTVFGKQTPESIGCLEINSVYLGTGSAIYTYGIYLIHLHHYPLLYREGKITKKFRYSHST